MLGKRETHTSDKVGVVKAGRRERRSIPGRKCILVIDDEESIREYVRYVLEDDGHDVDSAEDGDEGVRKYLDKRYDAVIMDIMMPKKDGVEAIIEMRRLHPPVPIVAISGAGSSERLLSIARAFQADVTLKKPVIRDDILKTLCDALETQVAE